MDNKKFIDIIINHVEEETGCKAFVVWLCKTLQNNKALVSYHGDGADYYEFTYNGDRQELYVDRYDKVSNSCLHLGTMEG